MPEPLVSIVIPTYNRKDLLAETLASVRAQTYARWEAVVVDDGSSDGTLDDVPPQFADEPRIRFFAREGERRNANVCRNQGFAKSTGDYVIFLDSDDLLAPGCLEQRVAVMERNQDLDFAVWPGQCFIERPGDSDTRIGAPAGAGTLDRLLAMHWPIQTTGPIWRRETVETIGGWDESLPSWQDVDFHFRALVQGLPFLHFGEPDYWFRTTADAVKTSVTQQRNPKHLDAAVAMFGRFAAQLRERDLLTWARAHMLAGCYLWVADKWVRQGDMRKGLAAWRAARREALVGRWAYAGGQVCLLLARVGADQWPVLKRSVLLWKWKWRLDRGTRMF